MVHSNDIEQKNKISRLASKLIFQTFRFFSWNFKMRGGGADTATTTTARNRFDFTGTEESDRDSCYESVYEVRRATTRALGVGVILHNIIVYFSRPIGGIGLYVPDGASSTGALEIMHPMAN
jgi:hypothetical protein